MKQESPLRTKLFRQILLCLMFITVLLANTIAYGQLSAGDIVVLDIGFDSDPTTASRGALFRVDPATGQREVLSDFDNASQGPLLFPNGTQGMAMEDSGNILVFSSQPSGVFLILRVNPTTGLRTIVSDYSNSSQGPTGVPQNGGTPMVVQSAGTIVAAGSIVSDGSFGHRFGTYDALYRVDPVTGQRTMLSDFSDPAQGPAGLFLGNMTVENTGAILLACEYSESSGRGVLLRIDPNTGQRTLVSDFGNSSQGLTGNCPSDVTVEASGTALVTDPCADTTQYFGALFRVDLGTGSRTLLSNFQDSAQGPLGSDPYGVATEVSGAILVADPSAGFTLVQVCIGTPPHVHCFMRPIGAIFRVDPVTGVRTVMSDFGDPSKGPLGRSPFRIEIAKVPISQQLIDTVNSLVSQGMLTQGNGNALTSKLQAAVNSMNSGNATAACNQVQAFINQTQALLNAGKLTQSQGQALIDAANAMKVTFGC